MAKQLNIDMRFNADTAKAKQAINDLEKSLQQLGHTTMPKEAGIDPAKFEQASASARELEFHLKNAFNTKTGNLDLSKLDQSLKSSGTNLKALTSNFTSAGSVGQQAFTSLARAIATADQPSLTLNTHLQTMITTLGNVARFQFTSSIMHGLVSGVNQALGFAKDLNESLNNIRIVTGQSTEQMARFAEQANKSARALSATTLDYTNASLIYYQQGLSDADVAARTETTVKLANVSRQSAEEVSDQMTAIWNNFAEGSENLEYYADVITALGAATASSSEEIAGGLEKFSSVAKTIGLSYEYASSALATIVATTRQSEDTVGTGLRTLFARFEGLKMDPKSTLEDGITLNKYSDALRQVGVSILDAQGQMREMDDILDDLGDRWGELSKKQQIAVAQTVGGVRQYTNLIALMDNWDFFKENVDIAKGSEGTLQEQADIYAESWEAARNRVKAAIEAVYSQLIDDDFFVKATSFTEHLINGVSSFIKSFGGVKSILTSVLSYALIMVSDKIQPAIDKIVQDIKIITGGANKVYKDIQDQTLKIIEDKKSQKRTDKAGNFLNINGQVTTNRDEAVDKFSILQQTELSGSEALLMAKTKLAAVNDKLGASERLRAQVDIQGIEAQIKANEDLAKEIDKIKKETLDLIEKEAELEKQRKQQLDEKIGKRLDKVKAIKEDITIGHERETQESLLREQRGFISKGKSLGSTIDTGAEIDGQKVTKTIQQILRSSAEAVTGIGDRLREQVITDFFNGDFSKISEKIKAVFGELNNDNLFGGINIGDSLTEDQMQVAQANLRIVYDSMYDIISLSPELEAAFLQAFDVKSPEDFKVQAQEIVSQLNNITGSQEQFAIDSEKFMHQIGVPASKIREFKNLTKQISDLSKAQSSLKDTELQKIFNTIKKLASEGKSVEKIKEEIKKLYDGKELSPELQEKINDLINNFVSLQESVDSTNAKVSNFNPVPKVRGVEALTATIGTLGQISSAVNAVSSAIEVWNNQDLTFGEKLMSTFMSVSSLAMSMGGIFQGFGKGISFINRLTYENTLAELQNRAATEDGISSKLRKNLVAKLEASGLDKATASTLVSTYANEKLMDIETEEALAIALKNDEIDEEIAQRVASIIFTNKKTEAEKKNTKSIWDNIKAMIAQKTAWMAAHPALAVIIGVITALVAAFTLLSRASKKHAEESLKEAQEANEAAKATKEQADANQKLVDSYKDALKIWNETQTNKEDLESAALAVAKAYQIENAELLIQAGLYEDLNKAIREQAYLEAQQARQKAESAFDTAEASYRDQAHVNGTNYWQNPNGNQYRVGFEGGDYSGGIEKATGLAARAYRQARDNGKIDTEHVDALMSTGDLVIRSDTDTAAGFIAEYEAIVAVRDAMRELDGEAAAHNSAFIGMQAFIGSNAEYYDRLIEARDLLTEASLDEIFYAPDQGEIKSLKEYTELTEKLEAHLREEYAKKGIERSDDDIKKTIQAYMNAVSSDMAGLYEASLLVTTSDGQNFEDWFNTLTKEEQQVVLTLIAKAGGKPISIDELISGLEDAKDLIAVEKLESKFASLGDMIQMVKDKATDADWEKLYKETSDNEVWKDLEIDSLDDLLILSDKEKQALFIKKASETLDNLITARGQQAQDVEAQLKDANAKLETASTAYNEAEAKLSGYKAQTTTFSYNGNNATLNNEDLAQLSSLIDNYYDWSSSDHENFDVLKTFLENRGIKNIGDINQVADFLATGDVYSSTLATAGAGSHSYTPSFYMNKTNIGEIGTTIRGYEDTKSGQHKIFTDAQNKVSELQGQLQETRASSTLDITGYQPPDSSNLNSAFSEQAVTNAYNAIKALEELKETKERVSEEGLEYDDIKDYGDYLLQASAAGDGVAESLSKLEDADAVVVDLSLKISLLEKGIKSLKDNSESYEQVLTGQNKGTKEYGKALQGLQEDMKDILEASGVDIDGSIFDGEFFEQNADKIRKAAEGDTDAIRELQDEATKKIVSNIELKFDPDEYDGKLGALVDDIISKMPDDIVIGTSIGEIEGMPEFVDSLNAMLASSELTIDEANAILSGLQFDPKVEYETITLTADQLSQIEGGATLDIGGNKVNMSNLSYINSGQTGIVSIPKINAEATVSTGRGAGAPKMGGSGKKGGGGGGGGGKNSTKEKKEPTDEKDRYHTIREQISDTKNAYDELSKAEDRAFGKERVAAMKGITNNLKEQIELQKKYLDEIKDYLVGDREAVEALGATFDANGVITNYDALIEELVAKYNEGVDKFNAGGLDEDAFKEQYEKPFNDAKEAISQYVETINLLQSEELNLIDLQNDLADQFREIAAYKLQLHIDIDEDELQYLDFLIDMLGEDVDKTVDKLGLLGQQFNTNRDEISAYTTAIQDLLRLRGFSDEDVSAFIRGQLTVDDLADRGFTTDDIDKLREYRDAIQDNTTAMRDLAQEIEDSFLDTLDELNDQVEDAEDKFDHFAAMLEHFHNVVDIVGQDALGMSAETMKLLAKSAKENAIEMVKAAKTQLDSLKSVREQAQAQLDAALEAQKNASTAEEKLRAEQAVTYWRDTIDEVSDRVAQAEEDLADALENALEGIKDMYTVMIEQSTKEFERQITGAAGSLEQLQTNFERQKETQDLYIPTYEKIYELTKLTRDINNSIDDTDNLWSKQELAKLQDEINQKMEDGVELTEHDVEELRKRYELKLAEAALEEAQDAKRTVRMSRDNEGNWSYVYTADEDDVAAAEQNYEDKLFQYQQMNYEYIQELQANIIQAEQDMTDQINDLDVTKFASKEAYLAEIERIMEATMAKEQQYRDQLEQTLDQQGMLYENDWARYNELTGYRMARDDDWVDNWNETILAQETGFQELGDMFDQLVGAIGGVDEPGTYVGDISDAYAEMQAANERALNAAGTSMATYEADTLNAVDNITTAMEETQNQVDEFANSMTEGMEAVSEFIGDWKSQYGEAVLAITEFNKDLYESCSQLIQKLQDTFQVNADFEAAQAEAAAEALGGGNRGAGSDGGEGGGLGGGPDNGNPYNGGPGGGGGKKSTANDPPWTILGVEYYYQNESTCMKVTNKSRTNYEGKYEITQTNSAQGHNIVNGVCTNCGYRKNTTSRGGQDLRSYYKSGGYTGTWTAASARTGMYTGSWNGPDLEENGRLAFLHQKELVLNASDTENFLSAIDMVRQISSVIDLQAASRSNGWGFALPGVSNREPDTLDQNVHIEAHFPNVTNHSEIEEAFANLVGKASQFANR